MPKDCYGNSQVREVLYTQQEIIDILLAQIQARDSMPYDFDYDRPIIITDDGGVIFRFVQKAVTRESEPRHLRFKPIHQVK